MAQPWPLVKKCLTMVVEIGIVNYLCPVITIMSFLAMKYRVVFEYQSEDGAMSDVYNCRDKQQALDKFAELRDSLEHVADAAASQVVDEPDHYSVINREAGIMAYVRLLEG